MADLPCLLTHCLMHSLHVPVLFCLQIPFMTTAYELKFWGVDFKKLVMHNNKDFLFSEVGLGGGAPDGRYAGLLLLLLLLRCCWMMDLD